MHVTLITIKIRFVRNKMVECVHRAWMPLLPSKVNRHFLPIKGHNFKMKKKVVQSKIEPGIPFMVGKLNV